MLIQQGKTGTSIHFSRTHLQPSKGEYKQIPEFMPLQIEKTAYSCNFVQNFWYLMFFLKSPGPRFTRLCQRDSLSSSIFSLSF